MQSVSTRNSIAHTVHKCETQRVRNPQGRRRDIADHVRCVLESNPNALQAAVGEQGNVTTKTKRLRFFFYYILGIDISVDNAKKAKKRQVDEYDDGHDVHRISSADLELLYGEVTKDILNELLCMLMLTTGLRTGGVPLSEWNPDESTPDVEGCDDRGFLAFHECHGKTTQVQRTKRAILPLMANALTSIYMRTN